MCVFNVHAYTHTRTHILVHAHAYVPWILSLRCLVAVILQRAIKSSSIIDVLGCRGHVSPLTITSKFARRFYGLSLHNSAVSGQATAIKQQKSRKGLSKREGTKKNQRPQSPARQKLPCGTAHTRGFAFACSFDLPCQSRCYGSSPSIFLDHPLSVFSRSS